MWYKKNKSIAEVTKFVYGKSFNVKKFARNIISPNPIVKPSQGKRPFSVSFEGGSLGDEGKGSVVVRQIQQFKKLKKEVITYRWNGGANAGHECKLANGSVITLHQLPAGILEENVTAIIGRSVVFHPGDGVVEIEEVTKRFGRLPGKLLIDENIMLCLDLHRALETLYNVWYIDYAGSATGRGIAPAYADELLRKKLTLRDLLLPDWRRKFSYAYDTVEQHVKGFGFTLSEMHVLANFKGATIPVGSRKDFLQRLALQREVLRPYVADITSFLKDEWLAVEKAFVFEGANGMGLHPRYGVYPDLTSSEIRSRGIQDSTEGIINHNTIAVRMGVIKGTYMSSVGTRVMPGFLDAGQEVNIRNAFGEFGKTTGRPRGILPFDIPAISYWRDISDYTHLVVTHMDADFEKILLVSNYKNDAGESVAYRPYQWYLNTLTADFLELPGWSGKEAQKAKTPLELPENALRYIAFLHYVLHVPIAWITTGQGEKDMISWLPK